jgi:hypothetical protein
MLYQLQLGGIKRGARAAINDESKCMWKDGLPILELLFPPLLPYGAVGFLPEMFANTNSIRCRDGDLRNMRVILCKLPSLPTTWQSDAV